MVDWMRGDAAPSEGSSIVVASGPRTSVTSAPHFEQKSEPVVT
jgi:hypothetical protein